MSSSDQSPPVLCRNCAVFYGAARFDNYCSKCYHDLFGATKSAMSSTEPSTTSSEVSSASGNNVVNAPSSPSLKASQPISIGSPKSSSNTYVTSNNLKVSSSLPASTYASSMMDVDSPGPSPGTSPASFGESGFLRKKRNICAASGCKKKLGLTAVECHCGHTFCSDHRYADKHNCSYDYKGAKGEALAKANPIIAPRKVAEF